MPSPLLQELLEPWAITQDAFRVVLEQSRALMAKDAAKVDGTKNVTMRGDVAVLHAKGPLFRYHSWVTEYLGTSSYGELRKDLQRCVDQGAQALLLIVDSPGGEVNGCAELADAIFDARSKIPNMAAYVSGVGASAAYFLTSAAGKVYCSQTSSIGSIGVITTLVDYSKMDSAAGVTEYELVSTQSPKKSQQPGDPAYRGRVQQRIDDMAQVFVASVAKYRGVSTATVLKEYGQGDVFVGQRAVDAGLADAVSDVESVIAKLQSQVTKDPPQKGAIFRDEKFIPTNGATKMDVKMMARRLGLDEESSEKQVEDRALALSHFTRDVIAATGAKDTDEALGKVRAGVEAVAQRGLLEKQIEDQKDQATQAEFRAVMKDAFKDGRLTLGDAAKVLPFLKDEEAAKATAALGAVKEQSRKEILNALCTAKVSEKRLRSIKAYVELNPPKAKTPDAKLEPALTDANSQTMIQATDQQLKDFGAKYGIKPASALALLRAETVEEAIEAKQKIVAVK